MGTYYWLKIKKDFYKRHDIKVIESMPNGVEYIWFYLKLMMESVDHDGMLRFSEYIPYNEAMLSTITVTNIDIVRGAMGLFKQLGMVDVLDDETIYIESVAKMIGSESSSAKRVRKHREQISLDKPVELPKIEEEVKEKKEEKHKHGTFKHVLLTDAELERLKSDYPQIDMNALINYFDSYIEEKGYKSKNHNLAIRRWVVEAFTKPKASPSFNRRVEIHTEYENTQVNLSEKDLQDLEDSLKRIR